VRAAAAQGLLDDGRARCGHGDPNSVGCLDTKIQGCPHRVFVAHVDVRKHSADFFGQCSALGFVAAAHHNLRSVGGKETCSRGTESGGRAGDHDAGTGEIDD
jgi:hypothetical protein